MVSPGVPQVQSQQGIVGKENSNVSFMVEIPTTAVNGTIEATVKVYPDSFSAIIDALKTIISGP